MLSAMLWAHALWQDLFLMIVQGGWREACMFVQEVEGLEAAAPDRSRGHAVLLNL